MSKQFILDAFDLKQVDRVPVGFWWHYTKPEEWTAKQGDPELFRKAYEGHRDYVKDVGIDLLKVMPDGFVVLPNLEGVDILDEEQLNNVKPADPHDIYYEDQVRLIKKLMADIQDKAAVFPTLFSPYYYLVFAQFRQNGKEDTDEKLALAVKKHPEALKRVVDVIAQDLITLSKRLLTEGGADGIFYAVHKIHTISKEEFEKVFFPAEKLIAEEIAAVRNYTILHVCGDSGKPNDFSYYADYPYKALNYSVDNESLSLKEAKEKFPDKVILGGFSDKLGTTLYMGSKEEIQAKTRKLIAEAGRDRIILGADCGLKAEAISNERISWVKEIADTL